MSSLTDEPTIQATSTFGLQKSIRTTSLLDTPRSYQIGYTSGLARKIAGAQEKHDSGQEVMGVISDHQPSEDAERRSDIKNGRMQDNGQQAPATGMVSIKEEGDDITFQDLPPVLLPDKESLSE